VTFPWLIRFALVLPLLVPAAAASPQAEDEERVPALLTVTAVRGVPDLERLMIERETLRRFGARNCGLRQPRPQETPVWRIELALLFWREADSPGGEPVFDPKTGGYLPGRRRDIETVYSLRVYRNDTPPPADEKPKQHSLRIYAESKPNASYEPREAASRMLREKVAEEVRRATCRAVRD
jgi:hypothetical protein